MKGQLELVMLLMFVISTLVAGGIILSTYTSETIADLEQHGVRLADIRTKEADDFVESALTRATYLATMALQKYGGPGLARSTLPSWEPISSGGACNSRATCTSATGIAYCESFGCNVTLDGRSGSIKASYECPDGTAGPVTSGDQQKVCNNMCTFVGTVPAKNVVCGKVERDKTLWYSTRLRIPSFDSVIVEFRNHLYRDFNKLTLDFRSADAMKAYGIAYPEYPKDGFDAKFALNEIDRKGWAGSNFAINGWNTDGTPKLCGSGDTGCWLIQEEFPPTFTLLVPAEKTKQTAVGDKFYVYADVCADVRDGKTLSSNGKIYLSVVGSKDITDLGSWNSQMVSACPTNRTWMFDVTNYISPDNADKFYKVEFTYTGGSHALWINKVWLTKGEVDLNILFPVSNVDAHMGHTGAKVGGNEYTLTIPAANEGLAKDYYLKAEVCGLDGIDTAGTISVKRPGGSTTSLAGWVGGNADGISTCGNWRTITRLLGTKLPAGTYLVTFSYTRYGCGHTCQNALRIRQAYITAGDSKINQRFTTSDFGVVSNATAAARISVDARVRELYEMLRTFFTTDLDSASCDINDCPYREGGPLRRRIDELLASSSTSTAPIAPTDIEARVNAKLNKQVGTRQPLGMKLTLGENFRFADQSSGHDRETCGVTKIDASTHKYLNPITRMEVNVTDMTKKVPIGDKMVNLGMSAYADFVGKGVMPTLQVVTQGIKTSVDEHAGRAGVPSSANTYTLTVPRVGNYAKYYLYAQVCADGGTASSGYITFAGQNVFSWDSTKVVECLAGDNWKIWKIDVSDKVGSVGSSKTALFTYTPVSNGKALVIKKVWLTSPEVVTTPVASTFKLPDDATGKQVLYAFTTYAARDGSIGVKDEVPTFTKTKDETSGVDLRSISAPYAPAVVDEDNDGVEDLYVGSGDGQLRYYRNWAGKNYTRFVAASLVKSGSANIDVGSDSKPAFANMDTDPTKAMFVGNSDGQIYYFDRGAANQLWTDKGPLRFAIDTGSSLAGSRIDVGSAAAPAWYSKGSWLVIGSSDGTLQSYYKSSLDTTAKTRTFDPCSSNCVSSIALQNGRAFKVNDPINIKVSAYGKDYAYSQSRSGSTLRYNWAQISRTFTVDYKIKNAKLVVPISSEEDYSKRRVGMYEYGCKFKQNYLTVYISVKKGGVQIASKTASVWYDGVVSDAEVGLGTLGAGDYTVTVIYTNYEPWSSTTKCNKYLVIDPMTLSGSETSKLCVIYYKGGTMADSNNIPVIKEVPCAASGCAPEFSQPTLSPPSGSEGRQSINANVMRDSETCTYSSSYYVDFYTMPAGTYSDIFWKYNMPLSYKNSAGTTSTKFTDSVGYSAPAFVNMNLDADGYDDLVVGQGDGKLKYFRNDKGSLVYRQYLKEYLGSDIVSASNAVPVFANLGYHGSTLERDLLVSNNDGKTIDYWHNIPPPCTFERKGDLSLQGTLGLAGSSLPYHTGVSGDEVNVFEEDITSSLVGEDNMFCLQQIGSTSSVDTEVDSLQATYLYGLNVAGTTGQQLYCSGGYCYYYTKASAASLTASSSGSGTLTFNLPTGATIVQAYAAFGALNPERYSETVNADSACFAAAAAGKLADCKSQFTCTHTSCPSAEYFNAASSCNAMLKSSSPASVTLNKKENALPDIYWGGLNCVGMCRETGAYPYFKEAAAWLGEYDYNYNVVDLSAKSNWFNTGSNSLTVSGGNGRLENVGVFIIYKMADTS